MYLMGVDVGTIKPHKKLYSALIDINRDISNIKIK